MGDRCKIGRTKHDVGRKEKLEGENYPSTPQHAAYFMIRIRKAKDTDVELQKYQFNVKDIPDRYWGNEYKPFMLVKLSVLKKMKL